MAFFLLIALLITIFFSILAVKLVKKFIPFLNKSGNQIFVIILATIILFVPISQVLGNNLSDNMWNILRTSTERDKNLILKHSIYQWFFKNRKTIKDEFETPNKFFTSPYAIIILDEDDKSKGNNYTGYNDLKLLMYSDGKHLNEKSFDTLNTFVMVHTYPYQYHNYIEVNSKQETVLKKYKADIYYFDAQSGELLHMTTLYGKEFPEQTVNYNGKVSQIDILATINERIL